MYFLMLGGLYLAGAAWGLQGAADGAEAAALHSRPGLLSLLPPGSPQW